MSLVCDSIITSSTAASNSSGIGGSQDRPNSSGSPIHSAPNLPSSAHILPPSHYHKKSRKKRKELDALVSEEKIRRKNSFSSMGAGSSLAGDSDDTEGGRLGLLAGGKSTSNHGAAGVWGVVPGVLAIVVVVGTAVMAMAALRLLMVTRKDMETLTRRLGSVEARSSELPARFHEAHVRLQELQRNTSALWEAIHALQSTVSRNQGQIVTLEGKVTSLESSVNASPQLSSLPQDVKALQSSVASFGSTLQDVQSAIKVVKKEHQQTQNNVASLQVSLDGVQNDVQIRNDAGEDLSIGQVMASVQSTLSGVSDNVSTLSRDLILIKNKTEENIQFLKTREQLLSSQLANLTNHDTKSTNLSGISANFTQIAQSVEELSGKLNNFTDEVKELDKRSTAHSNMMTQFAQNISVVKGVEKKLEGSQLQLASSVSDAKHQILSLQHQLNALTTTTTPRPTSTNSGAVKQTGRRKRSLKDTAGQFDQQGGDLTRGL